ADFVSEAERALRSHSPPPIGCCHRGVGGRSVLGAARSGPHRDRGTMNEVIRFALLGLGVGALYAFASQGLMVIYRGTGVLNFSLGATAIAGVFLQYELQYEHGHNFFVAAFFGVLLSATLGALTHWVVLR